MRHAEVDPFAQRLNGALERPPYTLALQTAPLREAPLGHFHWHIEILPALINTVSMAATGTWVNPIPPEEAAEALRKVRLS